MTYDNMTAEEIDRKKCEKEVELQASIKALSTVKQAKHELQREKIELGIKIKEVELKLRDVAAAEDKATYNNQVIRSEIDVFNSEYWRARNR